MGSALKLQGQPVQVLDSAASAPRRNCDTRRVAADALAGGYLGRFRTQPERCDKEAKGCARRFGAVAEIHRDAIPSRISLYRPRAGIGPAHRLLPFAVRTAPDQNRSDCRLGKTSLAGSGGSGSRGSFVDSRRNNDRALRRPPRDAVSGAIHSIAVLPLANLSGNAEQDYFADAMTDGRPGAP